MTGAESKPLQPAGPISTGEGHPSSISESPPEAPSPASSQSTPPAPSSQAPVVEAASAPNNSAATAEQTDRPAEEGTSQGIGAIPAVDSLPSTRSHHPSRGIAVQDAGLANILQEITAAPSRRSSSGSAVVPVLVGGTDGSSGHPPTADEPNIDDAPTVITRPLIGAGAVSLQSRTALSGRRLGHFELIEAIGSGGMAAVIKARDLELDRVVALKILPPEAAQDAESIARFKQEARAAALLDHENIARVYFCGEDQGLHFIAFEFVEGENLRTLIERGGPLPAAECVHYLLQVAAGLHHAWERGVVHRDIKPSNIIITPDGRAKIVDMGLARLYDAATDGGMTQSGVTLGTFDYISPEQALDPRRTDVRSDIYSLGCTFYHALTGRPPVAEGTAAKKLYAHQHLAPIDPRLLNPAIPDELAIILARMMAKDPARRYQTPRELIADLKGLAERWQLSVEMTDTAVQATPGTPALIPRPWPIPPVWLGVLTMAVLLVVLLGWNRTAPPGELPPPDWAILEGPPLPSLPSDRPPPFGQQSTPGAETVQVRTVEELVQAFRNSKVHQIILHPGIYDLSRWSEPLVARMKRLEMVGMEGGESRIRVHASSAMAIDVASCAGTLTFQAESFSARRITWEIIPTEAREAAGVEERESTPAGLILKEVSTVKLQDCIFRTQMPPEQQGATLVCLAGDKPPHVHLERCVFAASGYPRAGIGLLMPFGSQVEVEDSGFGPHLSALRFLPPLQPQDEESTFSLVQLSRSSFFVDRRSAVIGTVGPCRVRAGYCVFAAPVPPLRPEYNGAVLTAPAVTGITYEGTARNAYYAVQPLAVGAEGAQRLWSFDECRDQGWPVKDQQAERLSRSPWSENRPLQRLESSEPWPAFRLRIEQEAALFVRDRVKVIGAQFRDETFGFRAYPQLVAFPLPPKENSSATGGEPRQLIWQPHAPEGEPLPPGTAANLSALLRQTRPDDTILIRHDGLLPFDHTELLDLRSRASGSEFKITFKPYPKSRPVLTMDPANRSLDQFLFQLRGGEVEFVELQFLLKPSLPQNGLQTVAALSLLHGRGCTFDRCIFTLLEEGDAKAAVLHAGDPDKIMVLDGMPRPVPTVRFLNCLIRGKGRCLWVTGGRGLHCEWTNSLLALQGPIYYAEGGSRSAGGEGSLSWTRCTALLAGPLVELHGQPGEEMRAAGLPRLTVETEACLFVAAAGNTRPLVELHQVDVEAKNLLSWQTRQTNRYANFDANAVTLLVRPPADATMPREWDWDQWLVFAAEPPMPQKPLGSVTFAAYPQKVQDLASLTPADLRLRSVQFPDLDSTDPNRLAAGLLQPAEVPEPLPINDTPSPTPSAAPTRDHQAPTPTP